MDKIIQQKPNENLDEANYFVKLLDGTATIVYIITDALILTHIFTCAWYYSAKINDFNKRTWVYSLNY